MTGKELKKILENEGVTQAWLADRLNTSQQVVSAALQVKDVKTGYLERLCGILNWSMSKFYPSYGTDVTTGRPYYDVDFYGGFDEVLNDQTTVPQCYINFPQYNREGVVWCNITGHSMEPAINHGDIIAIKEVVDWQQCLIYGEIYAIVTANDLRTVKVIRKGSSGGLLRLVPLNKEYDEQELQMSDVVRVFSVLGSMKRF